MDVTCNLILDCNYLLFRNAIYLHKNNLLYGELYKSLMNSVTTYRRWFPFTNVYLVSDSKEKSWRKKLYKDYKGNRKKSEDMDWEFIFKSYSEFKHDIKFKGVKVVESPGIEGDDWISYIIKRSNDKSQSNIIVSNDSDIKQLLKFDLNSMCINIMVNELFKKRVTFLPKDYKMFLSKLENIDSDQDLFNINDNVDFITLMKDFTNRSEAIEVDSTESLVIKLISGDKGDHIPSCWWQEKNNKRRGIGKEGAKSILENYQKEFGEIKSNDPDLFENIADLICEKKKISKTLMDKIMKNLEGNKKLIDLNIENFPEDVKETMKISYDRF